VGHIFDGARNGLRERVKQGKILVVESPSAAGVHRFDDAECSVRRDKRRAHEAACFPLRLLIDSSEKPPISRYIVDAQRPGRAQRLPGNALVCRKANVRKLRGDLWIFFIRVWKVELVVFPIQQQDRHTLGLEQLTACGHRKGDQFRQLAVRTEGLTQLIREQARVLAHRLRHVGSSHHAGSTGSMPPEP
jgi:hypothetical protein